MMMPVSFGIPLGFVIVVVGAILYFFTSYKRAARLLMIAGAILTIFTLILIMLAVNSQM
jgi:hypothetical protein